MLLVDHHHLKSRRPSQNTLGARRILNAGQLYNNSSIALTLDYGFGHPKFIDTVSECRHILLKGKLRKRVDFRLRQR